MKCKSCGGPTEVILTPELTHYAQYFCIPCDKHVDWVRKPKNEGKRTGKNAKWRAMHKEKGFVCGFCGATEKEFPNPGQWDIDHIVPLSEGGPDIFSNTFPLCTFCHTIKNAEQGRRKALRRELEQECQRKEKDSVPW